MAMIAGHFGMLLPPTRMRIASASPGSNPFRVCYLFEHRRALAFRIKLRNSRVLFSKDNDIEKGESQNGEDESSGLNDSTQGDQRPMFLFKWGDLLNPDPQNILAVGLTGLLTWASVQVLWQLLFISVAILVAALKYTLIAAVLLFIVIALL